MKTVTLALRGSIYLYLRACFELSYIANGNGSFCGHLEIGWYTVWWRNRTEIACWDQVTGLLEESRICRSNQRREQNSLLTVVLAPRSPCTPTWQVLISIFSLNECISTQSQAFNMGFCFFMWQLVKRMLGKAVGNQSRKTIGFLSNCKDRYQPNPNRFKFVITNWSGFYQSKEHTSIQKKKYFYLKGRFVGRRDREGKIIHLLSWPTARGAK